MKKKLLLIVAMMAVLCCLLAISVSAKHEYTQLSDDALTNLDVKITLTDGTNEFDATVKFKDLFTYDLKTNPYSLKLTGVNTTVNVDGTDYTLKTSMTAIYIPDGVTHLETNFLKEYSTLSKACLPDSIEVIGDTVFYKCGTFSFVDENGNLDPYMPENLIQIGNNANNEGSSHFLSGCAIQNDVLVFPEGLTKFASQHSFNDSASHKNNLLTLVFLGEMTSVRVDQGVSSISFKFYFTKNSASDIHFKAGGSSVKQVETKLIDGQWAYALTDSLTGTDLSTDVDNTDKTLVLAVRSDSPNSNTSAGVIDGKNWYYQASNAITAYFCSGEMIMLLRNGSNYRSEALKVDNAHPFEDEGVTVESTCLIGGGTRYSCSICGSFIRLEDQTTEPLGHEYTEDDLVSSTILGCTQDETKTYTCQRCSEVFTVTVTVAPGHDLSIATYPLEATYTSLGTKRLDCANCEYYTEFDYRLDPAGAMMTVVLEDGTEISLLASLIFTSTFDEETQIASITGLNAEFTYGGTVYGISSVRKIIVPFGFNHVGYQFSNTRAVEIYDFSLTKDLILATDSFGSNSYVLQVILGDGTLPQSDAFNSTSKLTSVVIADGATVLFPTSYDCFTNNTKAVTEFIIGKGANVNFARTNFKGAMNSISKIEIGDGATVTFADSSFSWLGGLRTFTIGNNCNVTFGYRSFYKNQNYTSLTIGDSSTVSFGQDSFSGSNALATFSIGEGCSLSFGASAFSDSKALKNLVFPDSTVSITFTGDCPFKSCTSLENVYLPSCVTSLRKGIFENCPALKTVVLMGVTSFSGEEFKLYSATDNVLTIYSHATGNLTIPTNAFNSRTNVVLYTMSTNVTSLQSSLSAYTIYSGIAHAHTPYTKNETCLENGYIGYITDCPCGVINYGATYKVYTKESTEATTYTLDNIVILDEFDGHDLAISVTYANGYDKDGVKAQICLRFCGEEFGSETIKPIITHKGYSFKENGDGALGLQSGFHLDIDALNEYNLYNDDLVLGLAILNPKYLGESFFDGQNLNCEKGFLQVDIDVFTYSEISCMINFPENTNLAGLELSIFAYIFDGDDMQLIQKQYTVGEKAPVVSKVTKTDGVLHTVNLTNVVTPVALPETIKEYEIPTV